MDLELVKVQDGFFDGKTIYHAFSMHLSCCLVQLIFSTAKRTAQEEAQIALRRKQEKDLKDRRRREQEENVRRKFTKKGKSIFENI